MIKFLVMDVDGTLTDGKIYMGVDGESFKAFDIKDGYALHTLLKENGIIPVIITARKSPMVEHRCNELGVTEIHQGIMNKLDCLKAIIKSYSSDVFYDFSNVAYIGDDLLDLQCMRPIKEAGGITGCPSNAAKEVVSLCDYVAPNKGGEGAVRDFVEFLIAKKEERDDSFITKRCLDAVNYLSQLRGGDLSIGKHIVNDRFFYNVIEYETKGDVGNYYESHRKYVDIQLLLSGEEIMQIVDASKLQVAVPYDVSRDCTLYKPINCAASIILRPNSIMVLYPNDGHRSIAYNETSSKVLKVVGKVSVD